MQSVYILALVTLCQGLPLETRVAQLTAPSTVRVAILDPPAILVAWNKIFSSDVLDPIVGYKVSNVRFLIIIRKRVHRRN